MNLPQIGDRPSLLTIKRVAGARSELSLRSCLQLFLQDHAITCKMPNNMCRVVQLITSIDSDLSRRCLMK